MRRKNSHLTTFEFRLFRKLQPLHLTGARVLAACSGGLDSVALVYALARLAPRLGFHLEVASVHHGKSSDPEVAEYRDRAVGEVRALTARLKLPMHICRVPRSQVESRPEMRSEAELREFRLGALKRLAKERNLTWTAFAHHADDLLETRLIRLMRGTGAQGLEAMRLAGPQGALRPFLGESKQEIERYARDSRLEWVEDPSNQSMDPLRNWVRAEWLPVLERKRRGSVKNLGASLERLAESASRDPSTLPAPLVAAILDRGALFELGIPEQKASVAALLLSLGTRSFTSAHVDEILKRVRSKRGHQKFTLLGIEWQTNAGRVEVRRIPGPS